MFNRSNLYAQPGIKLVYLQFCTFVGYVSKSGGLSRDVVMSKRTYVHSFKS